MAVDGTVKFLYQGQIETLLEKSTMRTAEMNRRLATLPAEGIARVSQMIADGYGAHGITLETPYGLKAVNAVFALVQGSAK